LFSTVDGSPGTVTKILQFINNNDDDGNGNGLQKALEQEISNLLKEASTIITDVVRGEMSVLKDAVMKAATSNVAKLITIIQKSTDDAAATVEGGLEDSKKDIVNAIKEVTEEMTQVLTTVGSGVKTVEDKVEEFHKTCNAHAKEALQKMRDATNAVDDTMVATRSAFDAFIQKMSDGKSFTKRKDWNFGLMRGWSTQCYNIIW
jgi:hypothetical protein